MSTRIHGASWGLHEVGLSSGMSFSWEFLEADEDEDDHDDDHDDEDKDDHDYEMTMKG